QYTAAAEGETALAGVESMYAIEKVKMGVTEFCAAKALNGKRKKKMVRIRNINNGNGGEMGGFVLWNKVLVVMVTWLASKVLGSHIDMLLMNLLDLSEGSFKDLTQKQQQICLLNRFAWGGGGGEKAVNDEECFVLMLETQPSGLTTRSKSGMETLKHTVWGCFSQRTGLLVQLEDSYLVRIKTGPEEEDVLWETTSETMIQGYKRVDGIQIAHRGRTRVALLRLDESLENHSKTTMEESWEIEEVGLNKWL
ncbi:unnamed protein product, partial [Brassica rapa subsp. trilocularis]